MEEMSRSPEDLRVTACGMHDTEVFIDWHLQISMYIQEGQPPEVTEKFSTPEPQSKLPGMFEQWGVRDLDICCYTACC